MAPDRVEFLSSEWGPSSVTRSDLAILAELTGLTEDECLGRLAAHRLTDTAREWTAADPRTPEEIRRFYSETDAYLWELLGWNGSAAYEPYLHRLRRLSELWPPAQHPAALDFGSGVGTAAMELLRLGYDVTIVDVPGRTLEFARRRAGRSGREVRVLEVVDERPRLLRAGWDVLVSFDVVEHLVDPAGVARELVDAVKPGGGAAIIASFSADEQWPHHLAAGQARFADHRWDFYLQSRGLKHLGDGVYRRLDSRRALVRRAQYLVWRSTGLRVERMSK